MIRGLDLGAELRFKRATQTQFPVFPLKPGQKGPSWISDKIPVIPIQLTLKNSPFYFCQVIWEMVQMY